MAPELDHRTSFPASAGILFGLGLGGFFDGIVLHQILQWHHLLSSRVRPDSVPALELNTLADGLFHASTWLFVVAGLAVLWRHARRTHLTWPTRLIAGTLLMGFGAFNIVEGLIDHEILGLHHVNETVPRDQWIVWDIGFLAWGAAMFVAGAWLWRRGQLHAPDPTPRSTPRRVPRTPA
jgi:uncharacterized membrane protein